MLANGWRVRVIDEIRPGHCHMYIQLCMTFLHNAHTNNKIYFIHFVQQRLEIITHLVVAHYLIVIYVNVLALHFCKSYI